MRQSRAFFLIMVIFIILTFLVDGWAGKLFGLFWCVVSFWCWMGAVLEEAPLDDEGMYG